LNKVITNGNPPIKNKITPNGDLYTNEMVYNKSYLKDSFSDKLASPISGEEMSFLNGGIKVSRSKDNSFYKN